MLDNIQHEYIRFVAKLIFILSGGQSPLKSQQGPACSCDELFCSEFNNYYLSKGIRMLVEQILVGQMAVFCYLIGDLDSGEALLIDPASDFNKISDFIERYGLHVTKIINTHGHFDHTSGNSYFLKATGAELMIHENDYYYLKKGINRLAAFVKGGRATGHRLRLLKDEDSIQIGSLNAQIIHTPGHTQGSICIYCRDNLFTGDTLFTEGVGRTDFSGGSEHQIMDSIKSRILTLPDETKIWPGHHYGRFPITTVREQKKYYTPLINAAGLQ